MAIRVLTNHLPQWDEACKAPPEAELHSIPSQTTVDERELLYWFFSRVWDGQGDVCEVGPWLGGTTRAIAEGMLANPGRSEGSRFFTFDKFENYSRPEVIQEIGAPLVVQGLLSQEELDRCAETKSFMRVFDALHAGRRYREELLQVERRMLPHEESAPLADGERLVLKEWAARFPVVFVDGCKSWYSTRFFMMQVAEAAESGDWLFFQDHGWRTCYWLPCFTQLMRDALEPCFKAGTTLCLRWTRKVSGREVAERMPPEIGPGQALWLLRLFSEAILEAWDRGEERMVFELRLQCAAAMTAVGEKAMATEILLGTALQAYSFESWRQIQQSLEKPTYDAKGAPIQLHDSNTARRLMEEVTKGLPSFQERREQSEQLARLGQLEKQLEAALAKAEDLKRRLEGRRREDERRKSRRWGRRLARWFGSGRSKTAGDGVS